MKALEIRFDQKKYKISLDQGVDISIPLDNNQGPNCFNAPPYKSEPLRAGHFIGDTRQGSPVNFYNVFLNPHGNGTHTECLGHITRERYFINEQLLEHHFMVQLITCEPIKEKGDFLIEIESLAEITKIEVPGLIIRTLPNSEEKQKANYSGSNPAYFSTKAMRYIVSKGIRHLMVDLPSVDREDDGGKLLCHKIFWNVPEKPRLNASITEMVYIPDSIPDGIYFCNLQIPPFQLDAAPSKVIIYPIEPV